MIPSLKAYIQYICKLPYMYIFIFYIYIYMWLGQQVGMIRGWSLMVANLLLFAFPSIYSSIDRLI